MIKLKEFFMFYFGQKPNTLSAYNISGSNRDELARIELDGAPKTQEDLEEDLSELWREIDEDQQISANVIMLGYNKEDYDSYLKRIINELQVIILDSNKFYLNEKRTGSSFATWVKKDTMKEVKDIFGPEAQKKLSAKSDNSLKQMLGGKNWRQASMNAMKLLPELMQIEEPYRDQLSDLAVQVVERAFPFIEEAGIEIDAELVPSPNEMKITKRSYEDTPNSQDFEEVFSKEDIDKRKIINSITQGAALRGTKVYYLFDDVLDILDTMGVKDKYEELINDSYGIYDSDEAINVLLAMLSTGPSMGAPQGGESEAVFDEKNDKLKIKATALTFPILIQEIIKGLYELLSYDGIEPGKEGITQKDKLSDEPEAMRYGKFIKDGLRDLVNEYSEDPDKVRELFFSEVYKLDPSWFKIFIENVINDQLTSDQKSWVERTIKDLENPDEETEEDGDQPVGVS